MAIARALVGEPELLLADEPTGNLDTRSGTQVLDLLDRLNADGITLLVVTHDPNVARRADRVITLVDGRIVNRMPGSALGEVNPFVAAEETEHEGHEETAEAVRPEAGP